MKDDNIEVPEESEMSDMELYIDTNHYQNADGSDFTDEPADEPEE